MATYINFLVTSPRKLQLNSIAGRWHLLLVKILNDTAENLQIMPLQTSYELEDTTQPKDYNAQEMRKL